MKQSEKRRSIKRRNMGGTDDKIKSPTIHVTEVSGRDKGDKM
jgi:hypothetical protein